MSYKIIYKNDYYYPNVINFLKNGLYVFSKNLGDGNCYKKYTLTSIVFYEYKGRIKPNVGIILSHIRLKDKQKRITAEITDAVNYSLDEIEKIDFSTVKFSKHIHLSLTDLYLNSYNVSERNKRFKHCEEQRKKYISKYPHEFL